MFNDLIESTRNDLIVAAQEILKIKSVKDKPQKDMPFGEGPAAALQAALKLAESFGFKTYNMDNYIGWAEIGEGEDMVAVLGHLDVVPEGDGWLYPPYGAEIHDGKLYARGATDDKGPMIAALFAVKALKDSKIKLSKRIRLIFGTDEETGWDDIAYYKAHNGETPVCALTPDGNFPMINAEKGILTFNLVKKVSGLVNNSASKLIEIKGGNRANMVPDSAYAVIETENVNKIKETFKLFKEQTGFDITQEINGNVIKYSSKGLGAHGSLPHLGVNAISHLILLLNKIEFNNDDITKYFNYMADKIGIETNGKSMDINLEDKESGKLTLNLGVINYDRQTISSTINIRYPVTYKKEDVLNKIEELNSEAGITISNLEQQPPLYIPENNELVKILKETYEEITGEKAFLIAIGGGTYAKAFPNSIAFGPIFPGEPDLDHQPNENIPIESLIKIAKIYSKALYEITK